MQYTYFPVRLDQFGATIRYHDLVEGAFQIGAAQVTTQYLNHPALALGYRLEVDGVTVVYATDHEPHAGSSRASASATPRACYGEDRRHVEFLAGADLLIQDSQYTDAGVPAQARLGSHAPSSGRSTRRWRRACGGWSSSTTSRSATTMGSTGCCGLPRAGGPALEVIAAYEGQTIELQERTPSAAGSPALGCRLPGGCVLRARVRATVLIATTTPASCCCSRPRSATRGCGSFRPAMVRLLSGSRWRSGQT